MKLQTAHDLGWGSEVASRAEAWIETRRGRGRLLSLEVASRAEAWIETSLQMLRRLSPPVASRAEAWIETRRLRATSSSWPGRLPRGGVD